MIHYKNLLLALGITVSGSQLLEAKENLLSEDLNIVSSKTQKPSILFLEIDKDDIAQEENNVACSVSNSGCS